MHFCSLIYANACFASGFTALAMPRNMGKDNVLHTISNGRFIYFATRSGGHIVGASLVSVIRLSSTLVFGLSGRVPDPTKYEKLVQHHGCLNR